MVQKRRKGKGNEVETWKVLSHLGDSFRLVCGRRFPPNAEKHCSQNLLGLGAIIRSRELW